MQRPFKRDVRIVLATIALSFVLGTIFGAIKGFPDVGSDDPQGTAALETKLAP